MRYLRSSSKRSKWTGFRVIFAAVVLSVFVSSEGWTEDWVLYAGSRPGQDEQAGLIDWYASNKLKPASESKATVYHYYDQESVASNSPIGGVIFRVWERSVTQGEVRSYEETIEEIEKQEEKRLKRKVTILDMARVFPVAVKRAAKEIQEIQPAIDAYSPHDVVREIHDRAVALARGRIRVEAVPATELPEIWFFDRDLVEMAMINAIHKYGRYE